ncbi:uncharacterized protein EI90DRAFT_3023504 [Cantharellus anzutake]|uniref:uncharacterized protein n=1 Tax=Cantharellus anzutake TaxID=1750568 RepID=UPI001904ADBA|nr:uncharacterized protein EI90DRAFT_3023504 [Cantharellus anzutake]KAF8311670.1 hypothetical protein EI90DRAFT_3023504 [Cantharellus anzutake]
MGMIRVIAAEHFTRPAGAVFLVRTIRETVESTKANLKAKGYHVTDNGIHIKTDKRMDRESYMDATQRGFINGMEAIKKAGSFRNAADEEQKRQQELKAAGKSAPLHGEKEKVFGSINPIRWDDIEHSFRISMWPQAASPSQEPDSWARDASQGMKALPQCMVD